jgi:hypothetical protein
MAISPALLGISLILPRVKHGEGLLRRTSKYASLLRIACLIGRGKALREPCIWPFLSNLEKKTFSATY